MNGYQVYKYYVALKLHFTNDAYDVFKNRGRLKGTQDTFMRRNDRMLFERIARQFPEDRKCIQFMASNFMYGNSDVVYSADEAMVNYNEFIRRKQSITKIFEDDLHTIISSGAQYNDEEFSGNKIPDVIQLWLAKKITLETMVILNTMDDIVNKVKQNQSLNLLLGDNLLRVQKAKGFIKFNTDRVTPVFNTFKEEAQKAYHG